MRSEALDITIEGRGGAIRLTLSGPFHREQIPNIREKFLVLMEDGNRLFVVDMEDVNAIDDAAVQMFLNLVNILKGKDGELKFLFKNETVSRAFAPYQNLLSVYPDEAAMAAGSFLSRLRRRSKLLSRKTGVRISRPVAIFLLLVLCGWFITLGFIIHLQNRRINEQESELLDLRQYKQRSTIEINALQERIKPMEQLGILRDTSATRPRK